DRLTASTPRTRPSRGSWSRCGCRIATASRTAGTTGLCGARRRGARASWARRGSCMPRAGRTRAALLLSMAGRVAASGWLYVLRPYDSLPGPRLGDALPLEELSHRGSAALVLYVAVWGAAAVLLALLARGAGAEGLTAGLLLGPCVGAWLYFVNGLSILVVRQIPAHEAF